eukprot:PLAT559.1.p2 GENE.PLAT559.1~~PLAT559.1.p2  ORF type:complete len:341 (-),score=98.69 PLAT559.1:1749-2738(-)
MAAELRPPSLADVEAAALAFPSAGVIRSPMLALSGVPADEKPRILVKLECLQPIGSFKQRTAAALLAEQLVEGKSADAPPLLTASTGNFALGVCAVAGSAGFEVEVLVPEGTPAVKCDGITAAGGKLLRVPYETWWTAIMSRMAPPELEGRRLLHPVADNLILAATGAIGKEIMEDAGDVDAIIVPWGGGGLACGIAAAAKAIKPDVLVWAAEVEGAAPLAAALAAGEVTPLEEYVPSWVDGCGSGSVLPYMWPLASELIDASIVVSLDEVAAAVRLLATKQKVVAEGAGALPVAAARSGRLPSAVGKVVAVVSGGSMPPDKLAKILLA